ncbi:MAG TPA: hypothetical protein VGD43_07955, partial [Micromonospora sp.]
MRRIPALLGLPLVVLLVGCGNQSAPQPSGDGEESAFDRRAAQVAQAWRDGPGRQASDDDYIPLQDPTVLPAGAELDDDVRQALLAGWYREQLAVPTEVPPAGTIRFSSGTLKVPLVSAAEAYRQLDQGDPPPCPGRPAAPPPAAPSGPDGSVSSPASTACIPLTVTGVRLGAVPVHTTRGEAQVPAWLFTVEGLTTPVAQLAVAPSAVGTVPQLPGPDGTPPTDLVAAQDLTGVRGAEVAFRLGVGACDRNPTPLVLERDDVVVVA